MLDLLIVAAFVVYSVTVGLRSRKQASRSLTEYFLAGRSVSGVRAGMSMSATQFAADTPLLVMGLVAAGGVFSLWRLWIYGFAFLLMGFVFATSWRRAGVLTDAELVMLRYGGGRSALLLRGLKAFYYGTLINCTVLAFVLVAALRIFEIFLPWDAWLPDQVYGPLLALVTSSGWQLAAGVGGEAAAVATTNNLLSVVTMLGFVALYSTTGGLRSVIATDVVQLVIMLTGTAVYAWYAVDRAGGLEQLPGQLASIYGEATAERFVSFAPGAADLLLPFLVIVSLQWFFQMNSDGTGYLAQRVMACRDAREARVAAVVFTLTQIVVRSLLWLLIAVALLIVYPFDASQPLGEAQVAQRELTFALGMDDLLPVGARGLMLTGMLAALASTLDTHLNWGASYWSNDLYKALWVERVLGRSAGERELVRVARLSTLLILAVALVVMANLGSIQTGWQISLLFGAGTGAVLVMRWLWERVNVWCEVLAIAASLVLAPLLIVTVEAEWLRLLLMSVVSSAVVVAAALWLPATPEAQRVAFYRRVRPPGLWRRTARAAGDDPGAGRAELRQDLLALAGGIVSTYGWLVGFGRLLLQAEHIAWSLALVAVGCLAVPLWWPSLRRLQN
jgi:Na+/proline symporter